MTRDEVMAMTDEQLQMKAEELSGYKRLRGFAPPNYINDIAAAWSLRKILLDEGWVITIGSSSIRQFVISRDVPCVTLFPFDESAEQSIFIGENPGDEPQLITCAFIVAKEADDA